MKRRMGTFVVLAVVAIGLFGCGGGGDGKSGGGVHDEFLGSCMMQQSQGEPQACWEWSGPYLESQQAAFAAGCRDGGGTWSDSACPTTGKSGVCTYAQGAGESYRIVWYGLSTDDQAIVEGACHDGGGTWGS